MRWISRCHLSRCRRGKPLTWSRLSRLEERFRLPAGRVVHMWFPETAQSSVGAGFGNVKHNAVGIPYVATRIKRGVPDCRDGMSISFLLFFPGTHGPSLRSVGWRRFATSNLSDRLGDGSANVRVVVSGGFEIGEVFPSTGPIASQDPGRSGTIRGIVLLETRCARLKLFLEPGDRATAPRREPGHPDLQALLREQGGKPRRERLECGIGRKSPSIGCYDPGSLDPRREASSCWHRSWSMRSAH